ncbi:MAG: MaoC family dehydratase N-terminal domain-containing protein [Dehalococcoidales bacterium]|nr:MaoC family dehydratase N-terminal domain-containing protein [Dehalococcoidales bacterium]
MLAEEINKLIGSSSGVRIFEVEKGAIRRFADAVDDPNPLYQDEEYARNSIYRSIIAPPGFFGWPLKQARGAALAIDIPDALVAALDRAGYYMSSALDGGIEYEFFLPVRAGDILAATTTVRNLRERSGSAGSMVFMMLETKYRNQHSDLVATQQVTIILRSMNGQPKEQANA